MTSSRAAANAKILRQHQKRQSATEAKANTNKFTQKQSHFERRQEEDQIKQLQRGGGVVDSTSLPAGSFTNDAPSPFSMHAPRGAKAMTSPASTRSAVLGMGAKVTRATRRTEKFNLTDRPVALATPGVEGSLLGVRRGRDGDEANHDGDEPPQKKNRAERFREMLSASKEQRGRNRIGNEASSGRAPYLTSLDRPVVFFDALSCGATVKALRRCTNEVIAGYSRGDDAAALSNKHR